MALTQGTRLGPYEIHSLLGSGGMGEVYRARDTRLDRTVAIKVLAAHLSGDTERHRRFEREARAVSSLNHPHICTLYDIGHQDGIDYLVIEYLEGETVAARLGRGPLPTEQALRCAIEIADALDKAHRQGVIHRDLKPGNIMLTKSGAKLLDFGLAKLREPQSASGQPGQSALPTENRSLTDAGTILGTFQYMAPEQLEGKEADARTDIFAFGALLYEMATGCKAFEGKSQASLIGAILKDEPPPVSTLQPMSPPAVDHVVRRCLAKDPEDRWQTAHDVMLQLKWIAEGGSQAGVPMPVAASRKIRERLAWIGTALFFLSTLALLVAYFMRAPTEVRTVRSSVLPPEKASFYFVGPNAGPVTISPDGRRLAFVASTPDGRAPIWVRPLDATSAQALNGTEGASFPFWSADSRFIGFFADGKLKKIDASGGPPLTLCDAPVGRGGTWNRDGVIVFAPNTAGALHRVSASGGAPTAVTQREGTGGIHRWPAFLPDGQHFLYLAQGGAEGIYIGSLKAKESKLLLQATSNAAYADGHLLFLRGTTLMAQPFDTARLEMKGDAFPAVEGVEFDSSAGKAVFSVSDNGILAYQTGSGQDRSQLAWFDETGKQLGSLGWYDHAEISPDGSRMAGNRMDPRTPNRDVWVLDLIRNTALRLTFNPSSEWVPTWSPDGSRILFMSNKDDPAGVHQLYQKSSSGAGREELLLKTDENKHHMHTSLDGRFVAYESENPKTRRDIWTLPLLGERKPMPFLQSEFIEAEPQFSPDGRFLAYISDESGGFHVYVQNFPATGGKWQISTGGGVQPRWRKDGKELYYLAADGKLMAVGLNTKSSTFQPGAPRPLFQTNLRGTSTTVHYAVTPNGQRFLFRSQAGESIQSPITLVINWTPELRR